MIPQNEQGTIVLFSELAPELGYTFKEIGTACPDAILEKDGESVRVEFEYRAKSFVVHKHNPDDVDLIVCWEDNWPSSPVPVLSLEKYITLARPALPKTFLQRFMEKWLELKRARRFILICPMCGNDLIVNCSESHDEDGDGAGYIQWVDWDCPKCGYHKGESYQP